MAIASKYNFIGGYEHDTQGGLLHVADHHISPGKKQWTWGQGEFGQAWDRNLTDEDGPYIELMTGMFTDNQPDFSCLQPYEEKTFVQYFMPYREVGIVKNATKEAVVGIEVNGKDVEIKLYLTSVYNKVKIALLHHQVELYAEVISSSPRLPYLKTITLANAVVTAELKLVVINLENNKVLVSYQKEETSIQEMPSPAQAAKRPEEVENNEQLFLTGLHIEQYRHATYVATDYYEEGLRRDDKDIRCNNALGLWYLRRGLFAKAEPFFRKAITTLIQRNPNPYNGEPYFNLGWSLKMQGRDSEAYDAFYKSVWNDAWQHAGYLNLAKIACSGVRYEDALEFTEKALIRNYNSHTARHAMSFILRKLGRLDEASVLIRESLSIDPFNFGCLYENYLLFSSKGQTEEADQVLNQLLEISRNWVHNFIEYAFDYAHAGLFDEASSLLQTHLRNSQGQYPMVHYYLGWFAHRQGEKEKALEYFKWAATLNPDYCFPNRIEDVPVLQTAMEINPQDAKAPYYLGNFWYDKRQYQEAIQCWERSVQIEDNFPTVHRNLSLAYYNKIKDHQKALSSLEKAFTLDSSDARVLMELDQLYKKLNSSHRWRLDLLEQYLPLVESRDDLYLERAALYNHLGEYRKAKSLIAAYHFHPWEGGEGKVVGQYLICHIELAKLALKQGDAEQAMQLLQEAENYPWNLGEGKLYGTQENDIHYLKGVAYELSGEQMKAEDSFRKATEGIREPVQAIFYNDPQPDKIFYKGLAWMKLSEMERAFNIFRKLIDFGEKHIGDHISIDYFAVSLPDLLVFDADLNLRNKIHCLYLMGLGHLGLGNGSMKKAEAYFNEVLCLDINHQGAAIHKHMISFITLADQLG